MPEGVEIRQVRADDAEALAGVTGRAYAATYPGIVTESVLHEWIDEAPTMWGDAMSRLVDPDDPARAWVADRDGQVIGYATTSPGKDWWLPPIEGSGELTNLYLDPDVIGTGVGGALYRHAVDDLRARGFNPFVVWAFRDNARAIGFYERMGLAIDVPEHDWLLGGIPCPIVRFRVDWPTEGGSSAP
jgi:ribosomal protein S18 acetylase RimI-like enzyme